MRKLIALCLHAGAMAGLWTGMAHAVAPPMMHYQGVLTDSNNVPIITNSSVLFTIWTAPSGGTSLWSETHSITPDSLGRFDIVLGSNTAISDTAFNGNAYLGVKVGLDPELVPRSQLLSTPFSFRVRSLEGAAGGIITGTVEVTGFRMPTGATSGYVLTSDAVGTGTWQAGGNLGGSGTANYLPLFTGPQTLGNSLLYQWGSNIGIGLLFPGEQLTITGNFGLPFPSATVGAIMSGGARLMHRYGNLNFFAGANAGNFTLTGAGNTGVGEEALRSLTSGHSNTALGRTALQLNNTGTQNTAIGFSALVSNTGGSANTAVGYNGLIFNSNGSDNTAVGYQAMQNNTGGGSNTAVGLNALFTNSTGFSNTAVGYSADVASSGLFNASAFGNSALVSASNAMVFGNTGVDKWGFGTTPAAANIVEFNSAVTTAVLSTGGVWTNASDRNLKEQFATVDGRDLLNKLERLPISEWNYKKEGAGVRHIGPTAQDFYAAFGVGHDDKTISTIDPSGIALAAIQELNKENQELRARLSTVETLLKALTEDQAAHRR